MTMLRLAWLLVKYTLALFLTGKFSRTGNTRALNIALMGSITNGVISPPGDLVGNLSASLTGAAQTTVSCAASGGGAVLTKAIPDDAVLLIADSAGAIDTMETVTVNGAAASAATSITIDSQTMRVTHAAGSGIWLLAFKPFLALNTTGPTDNALGTEYSATGYARQNVPWTAPTAADPPVNANSTILTYGPFTAGTGSAVTNCALMDALSGGTASNMYAYWTLTTSKTPGANDSLQFSAASLTMSMS